MLVCIPEKFFVYPVYPKEECCVPGVYPKFYFCVSAAGGPIWRVAALVVLLSWVVRRSFLKKNFMPQPIDPPCALFGPKSGRS